MDMLTLNYGIDELDSFSEIDAELPIETPLSHVAVPLEPALVPIAVPVEPLVVDSSFVLPASEVDISNNENSPTRKEVRFKQLLSEFRFK